jgi:hypothetical protein
MESILRSRAAIMKTGWKTTVLNGKYRPSADSINGAKAVRTPRKI